VVKLAGKFGAALKAFRFYGSEHAAGPWSWLSPFLPGTDIDYAREVGRLDLNSIVSAGANYYWRNLLYPRMVVQARQRGESGLEWNEIPDHELPEAWENSPWFDDAALLHGAALSWFVAGNCYFPKARSLSTAVTGFNFIAPQTIRPAADKYNPGGRKLITYYEYTPPGGEPEEMAPEDVVHVRYGIDPYNPRKGQSPLAAAIREVYGENMASTVQAALIRNAGIVALLLSPKEGAGKDMTPERAEEIRDKFRRHTTGDFAGTPLWIPNAVEVNIVGHSPDKLVLDVTRRINVDRICSSMGIDPMVLGLESKSKTYSNYGEALEASFEGGILPMLKVLAKAMTRQCLRPDFGADRAQRVSWDLSEVPALQEDEDKLFLRVGNAYRRDDLLTKNEARAMLRKGKVDGGDEFYSDRMAGLLSSVGAPTGDDSAKGKALRRRWRLEEGDHAELDADDSD
jgi:phage portal protein BeeE